MQQNMQSSEDLYKRKNNESLPSLHEATRKGKLELVEFLLNLNADINIKEESTGSTPLHLAIRHGHAKIVDLLLRKEADVDAKETDGTTAVHTIALRNLTEHSESYDQRWSFNTWVLNSLMDRGCDIDTKDNLGRTPLHIAVINNDHNAVRVLLESGADINIEDHEGNVPIAYHSGMYSCITEYKLHIMKLKVIDSHINEDNDHHFVTLDRDHKYILKWGERYKCEVEKMREMKVSEKVTLMDIMTEDVHQVAGCTRSKSFKKVFDANDFGSEFVHYGCLIKSRIRKLEVILESIEDSLLFCGFPHLCVDLILMHLSRC